MTTKKAATFRIKFRVGRSKKEHTVYGLWSVSLNTDKRLWLYTHREGGVHFVENVTAIIAVDECDMEFGFTDAETIAILHL